MTTGIVGTSPCPTPGCDGGLGHLGRCRKPDEQHGAFSTSRAVGGTEGEKLAKRVDELREFLTGSAPLDGCWYGEGHPTISGNFWWRSYAATPLLLDVAALLRAGGAGEPDRWPCGSCGGPTERRQSWVCPACNLVTREGVQDVGESCAVAHVMPRDLEYVASGHPTMLTAGPKPWTSAIDGEESVPLYRSALATPPAVAMADEDEGDPDGIEDHRQITEGLE